MLLYWMQLWLLLYRRLLLLMLNKAREKPACRHLVGCRLLRWSRGLCEARKESNRRLSHSLLLRGQRRRRRRILNVNLGLETPGKQSWLGLL